MEEKLVCPICGAPTRIYMGNARKDRLCAKHAEELKAGKIILCQNCGKYHNIEEECSCKKNNSSELKCIICGEPSNGKHFCISCYNKFKNKTIYLQIKKCIDTTLLEAEYESDLICDDGHMVKSPYEKIVDNWLYDENIKHAYEQKIIIDKDHSITPDFYLPEFNGIKDIYIECFGYRKEDKKYQEIKEYKNQNYPILCEKRKITVVYFSKQEMDKNSFKDKLKWMITPYKVNY